ncbi:MBL fold metallo-hydrolase [Mycolicibacterium flavescens]|uniref:MBL fold metallo-hydrolase n=1 Tax=Mycolicibacterium flavescens TaxID=1776 RepID=A0A1E3RKU5_MYCFV|nr:MBL fold metallo-hydrolase [Mycolicibacterium flavescens]MCV7278978.1 MBL fold metallo-hydrolase [Mycolicibacterium flavescens]ODQ90478.1 MBL fold metallo-hydrolase [Mycolicibacterium flavescens]
MTTSTTQKLLQLRDDLWQTRLDTPFPGLTTHAYLWRGPRGNVLFYSPATEADFDAIEALGGISAQYLSHLDEAGPNLSRIAERFGSRLHAPAAEAEAITRHAAIDVALGYERYVDDNGVEVLPTPGHSDGSTSYLVTGAADERYLFTGDTMFLTREGTWSTFLPPGRGSAAELRNSVALLGTVSPDLVISSAFGGDTAWAVVDDDRWARCVAQALSTVPA